LQFGELHIQMGSLQITLNEKQARLWVEAALKVYLSHYPPTLGSKDHGV